MLAQKPVASLLDRIFTSDTAAVTDSPAAAATAAVPSRLAAETCSVAILSRLAAVAAAAAGPAAMASATRARTRVRVRVRSELTPHQCYCRYSGV